MSDRTKLILAVTLGSVGLALGILGTVVAFDTKSDVKSNQEIATVVEARFAEAQKRQDELEASQVSGAEKLVNSLDSAEKNLIRKINGNARAINNLRKQLNTQAGQISSLEDKDRQLSNQIANLQKQVQRNFNQLSDRIDGLQRQITRLQSEINP
jgi:predicted  nucleic acid-binding Zn-ribbon protein